VQSSTKQIAKQRVQTLFERAAATIKTNPALSTRYVVTARKIAMAAKIRLPTEFRRRTCKRCNSFLVHGENCRVRVRQKREPHVVITCLNCGNQTRILLRTRKENVKVEQDNHQDETPR
jgi:ribonuclease P protein subunit RPR2